MTNFARVYLKAADVIRANGLNKDGFFTRPETGVGVELAADECPVCIAGAVSVVINGFPAPSSSDYRDEFNAAVRQLADLMGLEGGPLVEPVGRLAAWNDAPERTADDVIAALEQAAKAVAA